MEPNQYRVIKIGKEALYEFIYEKFVEEQDCYLDVVSTEVMNTFAIDFASGEFLFMAHKTDGDDGSIIPLPEQVDPEKLLAKMEDTTTTMFQKDRYRDFTLDELLEIQDK